MMRALLAAAAFWALQAAAQSAAPAIATIDVYGSSTFDSARARAELRPLIEEFVALGTEAQSNPNADMAQLQARGDALEARMREALGDVPLAHFEVSMTTDFGPPQRLHVSLDIVEQKDAARRMPFRAAPTADLADPGGLLAVWGEYPYLARFDEGARRHEDALYRLAAESADAEERQHALFLLAHTSDDERLLPALGQAIFDPSGGVRNNAMRVLMFLAETRPELDFPVADLVAAFDFPGSSDRNKAGYTLAALAAQPRYRDAIRAAVPTALRVLRLEKPNNHDPAYEILKLVSGETYGDRDYAAWERWAAQQSLAQR